MTSGGDMQAQHSSATGDQSTPLGSDAMLPWGRPGGIQHVPRAEAAELLRTQPDSRVVLIGNAGFQWLKLLQRNAPNPRMDLRYLVEGVVVVLQRNTALQQRWLAAAAETTYQHLAARRQGAAIASRGTGRSLLAAEGAPARTSVTHSIHEREQRHDNCKALQIGQAPFQWLKSVQGSTRDPRLELRFLVEGAIALLGEEAALLPEVVAQGRQALAEHLAWLRTQPVHPFLLENTQ
jgi:hypothetical protein